MTVTFTLLVVVRPYSLVIVTWNTYEPAALNVAVLFLAALLAFALKVGDAAPLGTVVAVQAYVKYFSGLASAPSTERATEVPVTGFVAA